MYVHFLLPNSLSYIKRHEGKIFTPDHVVEVRLDEIITAFSF